MHHDKQQGIQCPKNNNQLMMIFGKDKGVVQANMGQHVTFLTPP
jgi:hypothetical protein